MQILGATDLGGNLAQPSTVVKLATIDLDEVDVVKFNVIAILVNRPVNLEARLLSIGQVVHIALAEERLEPVIAVAAAHVNGCVGQFRAPER